MNKIRTIGTISQIVYDESCGLTYYVDIEINGVTVSAQTASHYSPNSKELPIGKRVAVDYWELETRYQIFDMLGFSNRYCDILDEDIVKSRDAGIGGMLYLAVFGILFVGVIVYFMLK